MGVNFQQYWARRITCETFDFREISDLVEIGRGSFAAVFAAQYTTAKSSASKQVVVKKLFDLDVCEKGLFLKEVRLLTHFKARQHRLVPRNVHYASIDNDGIHVL